MKRKDLINFKRAVNAYSKKNGRTLPWRQTQDPYRIAVSEVMLQQTQVARVLDKYREFLKRFPTVAALAKAPLGDVLRAWSGLGYNRRAKMLHECAKAVVHDHKGKFPQDEAALRALAGVGPYTAAAICTFAFNHASPHLIETNIRTAYLFHFFPGRERVSDKELLPIVEATLDYNNARAWGNALMDYGAFLKQEYGNHNARSAHYTKQSTFKGSNRELRGAILRALGEGPQTKAALIKVSGRTKEEVEAQLAALMREGMMVKKRTKYRLP